MNTVRTKHSRLDTSVGDVVVFHLLVVPMGWNWAVCFVQQMLEQLFAGCSWRNDVETPVTNPSRDDNPVVKLPRVENFSALALAQAEADESLTRMLGRLEAAGRVVGV